MDDFTFMVLRVVTTLIALVIAYYVIPLLKQAVVKINDEKLTEFINTAVWAAQQTINDNFNKKQYVLEKVKDWLSKNNIDITEEQIDMLIESAVLTMKNATK